MLQRQCDAGQQAAAARGDEDLIDIRRLADEFQADGPLPGDHGIIVKRRDEDTAFAVGDRERLGPRFFEDAPWMTTRAPRARVA
ncbi:hypothetical protein [Candidatus Amarobacter glycogenicus]|uniref:hypothetical protein n=1 Tax=Candidatus Amarobacter glycogenicus TaxID=3140699 RepID=UPI0031CCD549